MNNIKKITVGALVALTAVVAVNMASSDRKTVPREQGAKVAKPVVASHGNKITPNAARAPMREVSLSAKYLGYATVDELDADAQIIITGSPTEDFLNRKHVDTRYPDGTSQDFHTLTSVQVDEIIKKPTDLKLEVGQLFPVIEPVGIIGEEVKGGGKKIKINIEGYQEMKKDKKYIIFLKSNGLGGFSVINMNEGKFNVDGTDPDDLGKEHTEKKEKLKKEVLSKYADKLK